MRILKAGIIGLGVGEQHLSGYQKHPNCRVVALADFSRAKRAAIKKKYPRIRITADAEEILRDPGIDIVSIASYDNYHFGQLKQAIKYNKHIFIEKPLCLFEKEARSIRALLVKKPELKISSNLILRISPRFLHLKKIVDRGAIGPLYYLEGDYNYGRLEKITRGWRGKIDFYSVVYGGGVHIVDLMLWLTGESVVEVSSYGNNIVTRGSRFKYNDMVVSLLKFKSGLIAKVAVNFSCVFPHFHNLSLYGTKATFVNGMKKGLFFKSRDPLKGPEEFKTAYPGVHKGGLINSFVDSILYGSEAIVTKEDIFKAMSICFAMEKAAHLRGPVAVRYI